MVSSKIQSGDLALSLLFSYSISTAMNGKICSPPYSTNLWDISHKEENKNESKERYISLMIYISNQ